MAHDPWAGIKKAKDKLLAQTPPPPDEDYEDDDMPAPRPKQQNDFLFDAAIFSGVVVLTLAVNAGWGFVSTWWNERQADEYFSKQSAQVEGRRLWELHKTYSAGYFMSAQALDDKKASPSEGTKLAQATQQ